MESNGRSSESKTVNLPTFCSRGAGFKFRSNALKNGSSCILLSISRPKFVYLTCLWKFLLSMLTSGVIFDWNPWWQKGQRTESYISKMSEFSFQSSLKSCQFIQSFAGLQKVFFCLEIGKNFSAIRSFCRENSPCLIRGVTVSPHERPLCHKNAVWSGLGQ